ncbi:MAG: glycosyltransferase family 39 protein [Archaeoglobaceae archaeon]
MVRVWFIIFIAIMLLFSNDYYLNDEAIVILQLKSIESEFQLDISNFYPYQGTPWFEFEGKKYAPFSYLLPILAFPIYKALLFLNSFGYPDLILALIAPAGFLLLAIQHRKYFLLAIAFFLATLLLFKPIYRFEDWAGIYALKLTNVFAIAITAEILYRMLKERFEEKFAISAVFAFVFATPVVYWTLSAKIHAISLMLTASSFYFLDRSLRLENTKDLLLASAIAGLCFFSRAIDGAILCFSILLFLFIFKRSKLIHAISGIALGYLPCAIFGFAIFNLPLPIEIIGNRFSNVSYIEASDPVETVSLIPYAFAGIKNNTLGILSYSPVIAFLIPPAIKALKAKKFSFSNFEKFLLLFSILCFLIYLPFLSDGVVKTGVRDYRFLLPIYIPVAYFLAKAKFEIELRSLPIIALCFAIPVIPLVSLLNIHELLSFAYLAISTALAMTFLLAEKFKNKAEICSLSILPIIFIVSDVTKAYFSPYDVHFLNPLLDRLVELLLWLKG